MPADENTASNSGSSSIVININGSAGENDGDRHLQAPLAGDMGSENNLVCAIRESSAAVLSSPSRHTSTAATVYSEDIPELDDDLSTPPSSPPPREHEAEQVKLKLALTPPPASTRKPTFSFLKRKRSANDTPLTELEVNGGSASMRSMDPPAKKKQTQAASESTPTTSTSPTTASSTTTTTSTTTTATSTTTATTTTTTAPRPALKQTTLDLGVASNTVRIECDTCGMHYIPSSELDRSIHRRYHDHNSAYGGGVEFGKSFVRANASRWVYEASRFEEGYVVIVDRKSSAGTKNHAKRVLEIANLDLGAVDIDDSVLWSKVEAKQGGEEVDRFKFFLHMKGSRCVGLALAERIWEAHGITSKPSKLIPKRPSSLSCSLSLTKETYPVLVGISRIWTCRMSRRKGIALDLLDCVVSNYFYGMEMARTQVAFSQPTECGCALMRTFYGDKDWRIYTGSC
ncbi:TPA_exp: putative Sister chromatid cohesion acetyltransferase Eco1 [Trichophyton benhamiae CBS 112371]|uniref:Sister chromatid cohesion acetyltransferase Eco1, putative n=1 Tax=Arthroderma benhamiae (strain ATCC MYA-4681 / CBS 112371) TaxID=663331 RepID=D4ASM5_ARTBC|nr:sister chromatid cohesion acetyltransferase Eco1, putative [Trichophyton benhamiae CBS 112371]EFE33775.1 sister chromatid cohesion acetyltransferase Eco1, putative [Trichophyton benhamiae CBS 112371]DAA76777.1 TPA_exp: putative Sister chromatid cohesion acetyltransferase Eco1 [Trichophyton benhamiae CBS 112371]